MSIDEQVDQFISRADRQQRRTIAGYKSALTKAEKSLAARNRRCERMGLSAIPTTGTIEELREKVRNAEMQAERPLFGWGG